MHDGKPCKGKRGMKKGRRKRPQEEGREEVLTPVPVEELAKRDVQLVNLGVECPEV